MRFRSLRAILTIYVALFLTALIALRVFNYVETDTRLSLEVDRRLASEVAAIIGTTGKPDRAGMIARIDAAEQDHDTADLYFMLTDASGRPVAGKLRLPRPPAPGYSDFDESAGIAGVSHGRALTRRTADGGTLVVVSDNDVFDDFDSLVFRVQLFGLILTAMIAIGGAIGIYVAIRARMRAMQRTVDAVIAGDLRNRVPVDGSSTEFDRQATAFNKMLDLIDELMGNIKHAAKDVTHELKSPLARLRTRVAAIERHAEGNPLAPDIAATLADIDGILDLFSSLLRLWEIEGGHRRERFVDVDLAALAAEVEEGLAAAAEDAGQTLALARVDRSVVRGDLNLLRQVLVNLVENAIRHTPRGTNIRIGVERRGQHAALIVVDDGPGIAREDHAQAVRKFGRIELGGGPAGNGLGLTLVDAIARLHDGELTLGVADPDRGPPGLRATVALPISGA